MARTPMNVRVQVVDIICYDEADGIGNAEPYLWPLVFKIDGDNYVYANGLTGTPWLFAKNGEHGNLGDTDVDAGDKVDVPEELGVFDTVLRPIPVVNPGFQPSLGTDIPGIIGIIVVLMEQDGFADDLATLGYDAFRDAVMLEIAKFTTKHQHELVPPSPADLQAEIDEIRKRVHKAVETAIRYELGFGGEAWYGTAGNKDDTIGSVAWYVDQDQLANPPPIREFVRRWKNDETDGCGDWSIRVTFRNLDAPPDLRACEGLARQIAALEEQLVQTTDLNEQKKIRESIAQIQRQQKLIGCI